MAMKLQSEKPQISLSPLLAHIWQTPIQWDPVTGHKIEPVNLKQLLHLEQFMRGDHHSLPVLPFIGTRVKHIGVQQLWNRKMSLSVF